MLLSGQSNVPPTSPFGYEINSWVILPEITGDNTEAEANFSYGASVAGVAQIELNNTLALETGLQLGFMQLTQTATERSTRIPLPDNIIREVQVSASVFHAGIPLFVKIAPGDFGGYLKVGARGLFNFARATSGRIVGPEPVIDGEEVAFPPGNVNVPAFTTLLQAGVGYQFFGARGLASYVELNISRPTGPLLENAGPRDANNRINYLDTMTGVNLGLTFGCRFGR